MQYQIDTSHSGAQFKVRHMGIAFVKGEFDRLRGSVYFDPASPDATRVEVIIEVDSISTRDADRDHHLKGADFFAVKEYPEITFRAQGAVRSGDGYKVTGDLTVHGVTKSVVLDVTAVPPEVKDPWGFMRRGLGASTSIDRRDFGMVYNLAMDGGGWVLGNKVEISIDLEMTRVDEQQSAAAAT